MIDKQEFTDIREELENIDNNREEIIQKSREILRISKLIIYSLHRDDTEKVDSLILEAKDKINGLSKENFDSNINKAAVQEYVEALCYNEFIKNGKILTRKELNVDTEDYLCGLCDLIGELERKAVNDIINNNLNKAIEIRELVDKLYGEFIMFNFRNGELRRKFDSIKWNLRRIDEAILTIRK